MRKWIGLATVLVAIVALVFLATSMSRALLGVLEGSRGSADGGADPMFAEPAEQVTRPPELAGTEGGAAVAGDRSDGWVYEELTPVDKTAAELAGEAAP